MLSSSICLETNSGDVFAVIHFNFLKQSDSPVCHGTELPDDWEWVEVEVGRTVVNLSLTLFAQHTNIRSSSSIQNHASSSMGINP